MVEVVAHALFGASSSSNSDSDFEILADDADTEESDGPTDPELSRSDYWTCIKCKNQKNNPMYRFCEKCYQVKEKRNSSTHSSNLLYYKTHNFNPQTHTHTTFTTYNTSSFFIWHPRIFFCCCKICMLFVVVNFDFLFMNFFLTEKKTNQKTQRKELKFK